MVMSQLRLEECMMQSEMRQDQAEVEKAEQVIGNLQEQGVVGDATFPALKEALWERQAVSRENANLRCSISELKLEAQQLEACNNSFEEEFGASRAEITALELNLARPKKDIR